MGIEWDLEHLWLLDLKKNHWKIGNYQRLNLTSKLTRGDWGQNLVKNSADWLAILSISAPQHRRWPGRYYQSCGPQLISLGRWKSLEKRAKKPKMLATKKSAKWCGNTEPRMIYTKSIKHEDPFPIRPSFADCFADGRPPPWGSWAGSIPCYMMLHVAILPCTKVIKSWDLGLWIQQILLVGMDMDLRPKVIRALNHQFC